MSDSTSIITVTFNPAIDQTVFIDQLAPGMVHRAREACLQAGGKGVNVATMLALGGARCIVTGFLGADNATIFERHFSRVGLRDEFVRLPGETRTGIKVVETESQRTTDINLPGLTPTLAQRQELLDRLAGLAGPDRWCVLAGSLPAGVEAEFIAEVIAVLRDAGAKIAVDSSGPALETAVEAGVDLIKPNAHELEELLGEDLPDYAARLAAARTLQREKVQQLVVSLGEEGALFLTPGQKIRAAAPAARIASTVGAGDALLAGYLHGLACGDTPADCARRAMAYAWCRLESLNPHLPERAALAARMEQVVIGSA